MAALLPVEEALARILRGAAQLGVERAPLADALHRVLAEPLAARRTQPPFDASAMDGYAVRAADVSGDRSAPLAVIGVAAAGDAFAGRLEPGTAVRIFTGAPVPSGADAVILQEDSKRTGDAVKFAASPRPGQHIRRAGLDFASGDILLPEGRWLSAQDLALAAAMDHPDLPVARRPRVGVLATGDELVRPGNPAGPDQIVASNIYGVAALAAIEGAASTDLGIARDTEDDLLAAVDRARSARLDVLVTVGGASVGEHDLVQSAFARRGLHIDFWRIAMRPGKPMMYGALEGMQFLGLPGNPVSSLVCTLVFLRPLLRALQGRSPENDVAVGRLGHDLPANDHRQDYLRAHYAAREQGLPVVTTFPVQDSSLLRPFALADCLLVRPPHAPGAVAGELVPIVPLH